MKNTEKDYKIKSHNITKRIKIGSGIFITSLLALVANTSGRELTKENNEVIENFLLDCEQNKINEYNTIYNGIIERIDEEQFDKEFTRIYNEIEIININGKEYNINELFARHVIGDGTKIIEKGNFGFDIVEEKFYEEYCDKYVPFKDASFFYQMYKDSKIDENQKSIHLSKEELINYIKNWNGITHEEDKTTIAENKTNEYFMRSLSR